MNHTPVHTPLTTPRVLFAFAALGLACFALPAIAEDSAPANSLTPAEIAEGWILLFDGETLFGWEPTSEANWSVVDGEVRVSEGKPGFLRTTSQFSDYQLKVDFRAPAATNSGIFLRTPATPKDPAKDCYEVNIAQKAVSPFCTASIVGRAKADTAETPDEWHKIDMTLEGGHLRISLDGRQVVDYTDPAPLPPNYISLQLNKGAVAFRNVKLRPLGMKPIFNGRDLAGWRIFPDRKSEFSVTPSGEIHVVNGNGQLETEASYGDFVLQLDVRTGGAGLNSGIFFRSIPGEFWQGYESQIQNAYRDGDPTKPVDCGTGGFYRRQNARKVAAKDFEWFTKTIVVSGPHMATWVNGYQVSDWTDTRPANDNPRQGLRLAPGTISIQGHDPTTDLLFRNLRLAEMPRQQ